MNEINGFATVHFRRLKNAVSPHLFMVKKDKISEKLLQK